MRYGALFPVGLGLLFTGFAGWMVLAALGVFSGGLQSPLVQIAIAAIPAGFLIGGLFILRMGLLAFLPTHCLLRVTPTHLILREQAFFLRTTKRIPRSLIGSFAVSTPSLDLIQHAGILAEGANAITIHQANGGVRHLLGGYDREILEPLARDLAAALGKSKAGDATPVEELPAQARGPEESPPEEPLVKIEYVPADNSQRAVYEYLPRHTQPASSNIVLAPTADTLTFLAPPTGFRGTTRSFLTFGVLWTVLSGMFFLFDLVDAAPDRGLGDVLMPAVFVLVGLVIVGVSIQTARAKSVLVATRDRLVFSLIGPFRKRELEIPAAAIVRIAPGPTGTEIANTSVLQLTIDRQSPAQPAGVFGGRPRGGTSVAGDSADRFLCIVPRDRLASGQPPAGEANATLEVEEERRVSCERLVQKTRVWRCRLLQVFPRRRGAGVSGRLFPLRPDPCHPIL